MKKLFKVIVEHYSQKDSHKATETFLLAESDELVYDCVDKKNYGLYSDKNEEYESIGVESYKAKMLRVGGEFFAKLYDDEVRFKGGRRRSFISVEEAKEYCEGYNDVINAFTVQVYV